MSTLTSYSDSINYLVHQQSTNRTKGSAFATAWKTLLQEIRSRSTSPSILSDSSVNSGLGGWINGQADFLDNTSSAHGFTPYFESLLSSISSQSNVGNNYKQTPLGAQFWNESTTRLINYIWSHFDVTTMLAGETESKGAIPGTGTTKGSFRLYDILHANAGNSFNSSTEPKWVIAWKNVDNKNYSEVRGNDKINLVLNWDKKLQFTSNNGSRWIRLLMPQYNRRVEVEDLNRNFWVIAQTIAAICAYLFDEDSPFKNALSGISDEVVQLWDNVLSLWDAAAIIAANADDHTTVTQTSPFTSATMSSWDKDRIQIAVVHQQGQDIPIYAPYPPEVEMPDPSEFKSAYTDNTKKTYQNQSDPDFSNVKNINNEIGQGKDKRWTIGYVDNAEVLMPPCHPYGKPDSSKANSWTSEGHLLFGGQSNGSIYGVYQYDEEFDNTYRQPMIRKNSGNGDWSGNLWIGGNRGLSGGTPQGQGNFRYDSHVKSDSYDHMVGNVVISMGWADYNYSSAATPTITLCSPEGSDTNRSPFYRVLHEGNLFTTPLRLGQGVLSAGLQKAIIKYFEQDEKGDPDRIEGDTGLHQNSVIEDTVGNNEKRQDLFSISGGTGIPLYVGHATVPGTGKEGAHWFVRLGNTSSKKVKKDINYSIDLNKYHENLMNFKPCEFIYKQDQENRLQLGLIAEDLNEINELYAYPAGNEIINYSDRPVMTSLVIEAQYKDRQIKELQDEVALLKTEIETFKSLLNRGND